MAECDEIQRVLLDILQTGLLRIRAFGDSGLAEACSLEADHLHNIPIIIKHCNQQMLVNYYTIERAAFLHATALGATGFEPLWERLGKLIESLTAKKLESSE